MLAALDVAHIPLLHELSVAEVIEVLRGAHYRDYQRGDFLFNTGEPADALFLLDYGSVKICYSTLDGDEKLLSVFEAGGIFGELFLGKYRYRIGHAIALEDCGVYKISEAHLLEAIQQCPRIAVNLVRHLADEQREVMARLSALQSSSSRIRLLGTLLSLSRQLCCAEGTRFVLNPNITQVDIANMTGLNRCTVSSLINQFRREGLLGGTGRELIIHYTAIETLLHQEGMELLE